MQKCTDGSKVPFQTNCSLRQSSQSSQRASIRAAVVAVVVNVVVVNVVVVNVVAVVVVVVIIVVDGDGNFYRRRF